MKNLKVVQFDFGFECNPIFAKEKVVKPTKKDKTNFVFYLWIALRVQSLFLNLHGKIPYQRTFSVE